MNFILFLLFALFILLLFFAPFIFIGLTIYRFYRRVHKTPGLKRYLDDPFGASSQEIQSFAAVNSFHYDSGPSDAIGSGSLSKVDSRLKAANIVSGSIKGNPFRFYETVILQNILFSSRTNVSRISYVAEVEVPYQLPHVYIREKNSNGGRLISNFDSSQEMDVGGPFGEHYRVFALQQEQLDVRSLLPPDVQATILGDKTNCDIELVGSKVYFYWPIALGNKNYRQSLEQPLTEEKFYAFQRVYGQLSEEINKGGFKQQPLVATKSEPHLKRGLDKSSRFISLAVLLVFTPLMVGWLLANELGYKTMGTIIGSLVGVFIVLFFGFLVVSYFRQSRRREYDRKKYKY